MIFKDRKDFLRRKYGERALQEYRRATSSQTPAPIHQDQSQDDLDIEAISLDDITDDVSPTEERSGEASRRRASPSEAGHSGPHTVPPLPSSSSDHGGPGYDDDQDEDDEDEDGESEGSSIWRGFHPDEDSLECPSSPRPVQWPHHIRYETDSDESESPDDWREPSPPSPPHHLRVPGRRYQSSLRPLSPRRSESDLSATLVLNRPYYLIPPPSLTRSEEQARIALHLESYRRLWESEREWLEEQDDAAEPPSSEQSSSLRSSLLRSMIRTLPAPPRRPRRRRRSPLGRQVIAAADLLARVRRPTPSPDRPYSPPLSDEDDDEEHDEEDWNYPIADVTMVDEDITTLSPPLEPQRSHTGPSIMPIAALMEPPNFPFPREALAPRSLTWLRPYEEQTSGSDDDDDEADAVTQNVQATIRTNEENERIRHELFSSSSGSSHSSEDGSDSGSDASNHDRQSSSDEDDHDRSHPGHSRPRDHSSDDSHDEKEESDEDVHPDDNEYSPSTDNRGDAEDIRSAYDGCNLDSPALRLRPLCAQQLQESPDKCLPLRPRTDQERVNATLQRGSRRPLRRHARGRTDQIKALGWTSPSDRSRTIDNLEQSISSSAPFRKPFLKTSGSVSLRAPCHRQPSPESLGKRPRLHSPPRSGFGHTSVLSAAFLPLFGKLETSDPLFSSSSGSSDDSTISSEPDSAVSSPERLTDSPQSAQVGELTAAFVEVMQPQSVDS